MDIAVIGASGDVGRAIATRLVTDGLLSRHERLQLVGRRGHASEKALEGFTVDLLDAYAERAPLIDVACAPEEVTADLVIMAAGRTLDVERRVSRADLAQENAASFREYARALRNHGTGHELVLVVSNPVELAVAVFAHELGRRRTFGMAAYLDSLRFRKEIARELRIGRQAVHAFMAGEHGDHLVPLWSSVDIFGVDRTERDDIVQRLRNGGRTEDFLGAVRAMRQTVSELVALGDVRGALRQLDALPPDLRAACKPFVTHFSGAKTTTATAEATVEFVSTIYRGHQAVVSGQVLLEGEYGIEGPLGVPFVLSMRGIEDVVELDLAADERQALRVAADHINRQLALTIGARHG